MGKTNERLKDYRQQMMGDSEDPNSRYETVDTTVRRIPDSRDDSFVQVKGSSSTLDAVSE